MLRRPFVVHTHPHRPMRSAVLFFLCTAVMTGVLILIWKILPVPPRVPVQTSSRADQPVTKTDAGLTQAACETGGGKWTDCAGPCLGKNEGACARVCVPQCLCGGKAEWSCPKNFVCSAASTDAVGACAVATAPPAVSTVVRERPAGMICDAENFICISESLVNATLTNPFTVTGTAVAFENRFVWKLEEANGNVFFEEPATFASADAGLPGTFEVKHFFPSMPESVTGTLTLYAYSAKDGLPVHVLNVPVLLPQQKMSVQFFVPPEGMNWTCADVVSSPRVLPRSPLPIEATLRAFIAQRSSSRLAVEFLAVRGGMARVRLRLQEGDLSSFGRCDRIMFASALSHMLKQFRSVKNVEVTISDGTTTGEITLP